MTTPASPQDTATGRRPAATDAAASGPPPGSEPPRGYLGETMAELRMVVWPSRQQLFSESVAVILMVSLSAAAIAAVDRFFGWGAGLIFR